MLTRMKIKGFRSFSQESYQEVKFSKVNIIVGENNVGKSNILKAIKFALGPGEEGIIREDFSIRRSKSRSRKIGYSDKKARQIEILLYFDDINLLPKKYQGKVRKKEYELKMIVSGNKPGRFVKKYYLDGKDVFNMHFNKKQGGKEVYEELLKDISIHITPTIRDIEYLEIFKEMLPLAGRSDIRRIVDWFANEISKKMKPKLSAMRKQLGVEGVEFVPKVDMEKILSDTRFDFIINEGYHIPIKNVGQGYVSKSIIALAINSNEDILIGIEEPELHMHPNAIRDLIRSISEQRANKQFIITSHSPTITNFVEPNEIVVVKKVNRYSKVYQLVDLFESEVENYIDVARQVFLNRQKTELLFARGIVLVEGPYDRIIYEKISEKSNVNLLKNGICIVDTGSDYFIPYMTVAKTLNLAWAIVADKKAVYDPSNAKTGFGSYLKGLCKHGFVSEQEAKNIVDSIKNNYSNYDVYLDAINKKLDRVGGKAIFLKGDDLSDEVILSVDKMAYVDLKNLFIKFGGSRYETDRTTVLDACKKKIRKKDWDMVEAIEVMNSKHLESLTSVIQDAANFCLQR